MHRTVGTLKAEQMLSKGTLVTSAEALELGLIDELVEPGTVMEAAQKELTTKMLNIADPARQAMKAWARQELAQFMRDSTASDAKTFADFVLSPQVQKLLKAYTASVRK